MLFNKRQVSKDVPSLLVRGSGKAADLISDAVKLKDPEAEPGYVEQKMMWRSVFSILYFRGSFSLAPLPPLAIPVCSVHTGDTDNWAC